VSLSVKYLIHHRDRYSRISSYKRYVPNPVEIGHRGVRQYMVLITFDKYSVSVQESFLYCFVFLSQTALEPYPKERHFQMVF